MPGEEFHQFNPDETFPTEPLDPQAPYTPGNRPASGARRATPGEVLTRGFQGSQTAGDFLGLDLEFTASQGSEALPGRELDLEPAPATYAEDQSIPAGYPQDAPLPASSEQGFGGGPSSFEFGEDLGGDELALDAAPKKNAVRTFLLTLAVGGVVAAGALYGPSLYSRFAGSKPKSEVARAPRDPAPPQTSAEPAVGAVDTAPIATLVEPEPAATDVLEPDLSGSSDPLDLVATVGDPEPVTSFFEPEPDAGLVPGASVSADDLEPANDDIVASLLAATSAEPTAAFPNLGGSDFEWASDDLLELIWRGNEVPMEAVFAPARTIMPRVGAVRVFTSSGDVFEGRLYAVGQERVWIDAVPGRIGLDGNRVERIERLTVEPSDTDEPGPAPSGKRVRVRVPGGLLFGRVLKTEGDEVILALDDGGRVRVMSDTIEEMGTGRAIIVHR